MMQKYARAEVLSAERRPSFFKRAFRRVAHKASFDYEPREGFIYVRSRMISSRCNDNFDEFPAEEIKKGYRTFIGRPVYVNHDNDDPTKARGVIIDAVLHEDETPQGLPDTWVEGLMEIDAVTYPMLAEALLNGDIERTSMGVNIEYSICSFCGNKAETPLEYCRHVPAMKGSTATRVTASGEKEDVLIRERCYGLNFFENSVLVEPPADPTAHFLDVDARGVGGGYKGSLAKAASRSKTAVGSRRTAAPEWPDPVLCDHTVDDYFEAAGPGWSPLRELAEQVEAGEEEMPVDALDCPLCESDREYAERFGPYGSRKPARHGLNTLLRAAAGDVGAMDWTATEDEQGWGAGELAMDTEMCEMGPDCPCNEGGRCWMDQHFDPRGPHSSEYPISMRPNHYYSRRKANIPGTERVVADHGAGLYWDTFVDREGQVFLANTPPGTDDFVGTIERTPEGWREGWNGTLHATKERAINALIVERDFGDDSFDPQPRQASRRRQAYTPSKGEYEKGDRILYEDGGQLTVAIVDSDNGGESIWVKTEHGLWKMHRSEVVKKMGRRQAARLDDARVPVEVNTLTGGDCPVCGNDNYDGTECDTCGYTDPGENFTEPDLTKAKEFRETGEVPAEDAEEADFETMEGDEPVVGEDGEPVEDEEQPMDVDEALAQSSPEDEALLQEALDMLKEVREMIGPDALDKSLQDEVRETIEEMRGLMGAEGDEPALPTDEVEGPEEDVEDEEPPFETSDEEAPEDSEDEDSDEDEDDEEDEDNPFAKKSNKYRHHFR